MGERGYRLWVCMNTQFIKYHVYLAFQDLRGIWLLFSKRKSLPSLFLYPRFVHFTIDWQERFTGLGNFMEWLIIKDTKIVLIQRKFQSDIYVTWFCNDIQYKKPLYSYLSCFPVTFSSCVNKGKYMYWCLGLRVLKYNNLICFLIFQSFETNLYLTKPR